MISPAQPQPSPVPPPFGLPPEQNPDVSIIVVSWNARKFLEECLISLSSEIACRHEVIVVDNASTDGSPEMISENFPNVILVRSQANLGFARANNIGIARSRGRYLALVNSDVNVLPFCIDRLVQLLDRSPTIGMAGPRIMYGDRTQQATCRHFPTVWNTLCEALYLNKLFFGLKFFSGEQMNYFSYDRTEEVEVLSGCFIVARHKAVDEFGLLDEGFWMYGEDVDWCQRCRQSGWKVVFDHAAESIHYGGASSANDPARFAVELQRARIRLWKKHHSKAAQLSLFILIVVQCLIRILAATIKSIMGRAARPAGSSWRIQLACLRSLWPRSSSPGR